MSLRKEYSVQLFNRYFEQSNSWNSKYYVVYYGVTPQHTFIEAFPEGLRTRNDKAEFLQLLINALKNKREVRNQRARKRYQESRTGIRKESKKAQKVTSEDIEEVYADPNKRKFSIYSEEKETRGKFINDMFYYRVSTLAYDRPINVNVRNKQEFRKLREVMTSDISRLIDEVSQYSDGTRNYIIKFVTPFYDLDDRLMYDDELKGYTAPTSYSYGFSVGRARALSKQRLMDMFDFTFNEWEMALATKYDQLTSKIDLGALLIEETIDR